MSKSKMPFDPDTPRDGFEEVYRLASALVDRPPARGEEALPVPHVADPAERVLAHPRAGDSLTPVEWCMPGDCIGRLEFQLTLTLRSVIPYRSFAERKPAVGDQEFDYPHLRMFLSPAPIEECVSSPPPGPGEGKEGDRLPFPGPDELHRLSDADLARFPVLDQSRNASESGSATPDGSPK